MTLIVDYKKQDIKLTVDNVIFTIINNKVQILLIKRLLEPYINTWALPGWYVLNEENTYQATLRELEEETNVTKVYLEQLYTFSEVDRDPRWRVVTVAYMALVNSENLVMKAWSDAKEIKFFPINRIPKLAFDHKNIVKYWIKRLQWKLEYTNAAQYFLPKKFILSDLKLIYDIIFDKVFDVRNFRKKIDKLDLIQETWEMQVWVKHRPAMLYEFKNKNLEIVDII